MDIKQFINEEVAKFEEVKKNFVEQLKPKFKEVGKDLFENHPKVEGIFWNQYVPSFNDGEPCEFSVSDIYFFMNERDEDEELEESCSGVFDRYDLSTVSRIMSSQDMDKVNDWEISKVNKFKSYSYDSFYKINELDNHFNGVKDTIESIPDDILEELFGTGVRIILTRKDMTIEEYDCGY